MNRLQTKASLSEARRHLVEWMQDIDFGTIYGLTLRRGEPVLDPRPRVVRERKFPADAAPRPDRGDNFLLKAQVVELYRYFDEIGDGLVESLEIKHGLPFRAYVAEAGV